MSGGGRIRGGWPLALGLALPLLVVVALPTLGGLESGTDEVTDATARATSLGAPNVVVVQTDDQRSDDLRVMRKSRRLLAEQGTTFTRQFATHPRCCPSRASYLTGQYSHSHGVQSSDPAAGGGFGGLDHGETLPVWLERAGYVTGHIGKYLNGYGKSDRIPPGWTEWYSAVAGSATSMYGYTLVENGRAVEYGGSAGDYQTDVYADKAVDFIRRRSGRSAPFFLSVNPSAPHTERRHAKEAGPALPRNPRPARRHFDRFGDEPLPKPRSYNERDVSDKPKFIRARPRITEDREGPITRRYRSRLESLLAVDDMVERIVKTLEGTGELDDTVILLTSDNGYFQGEHRLPNRKAHLYEEGVGVPLVIRGPGFPAGATRRQLTANIDLAPTILDVAGAEARDRTLDGISLMPLAQDRREGSRRDLLFDNGVGGSRAVRTRRLVYIEHSTGERELYDLRRDPFQLRSRHRGGRYRDARRSLDEYLGWLRRCSGEVCAAGPPRLRLRVDYEQDRTEEDARCVASDLAASVGGRDRNWLRRVVFSLDGTRVGAVDAPPFEQEIPRRRLSGTRSSTVEALARLDDGRRLTMYQRVPRRCG